MRRDRIGEPIEEEDPQDQAGVVGQVAAAPSEPGAPAAADPSAPQQHTCNRGWLPTGDPDRPRPCPTCKPHVHTQRQRLEHQLTGRSHLP
jgi:hypothetical protein